MKRHAPKPVIATEMFGKFLPMSVTCSDPSEYEMTAVFVDDHLNATGAVHGGILSTLLDISTAGAGAMSVNDGVGTYGITISLTVNFVQPTGAGPVRSIARVLGGGARTKFVEAKILDEQDNLVASASATIKVVDFDAEAQPTTPAE